MEHVFPTCTMPRVDFHALANQNLNEFWKGPANRYRSAAGFSGVFLKIKGILDNSAISQKLNGKNANSQ